MKKDYLWNTIGVLAQNAISPLLLVIVTRFNGIEDSGVFSFSFSVAIIFWTISMWGGRTYQVSDVKKEFSNKSYLMVRLLLGGVVFLAAVLFCILNQYDATKTGVILALVLFKIIESVADALYGVMQVHDRLYIAGKSLLYKSLAGFVAFVLVDVATNDIFLSSMAIVLSNMIVVACYDIPVTRRLESVGMSLDQLKSYSLSALEIIKRCWPVFIVAFLGAFSLNIPRYFLDIYHQEQIGYFGILAMPVTLVVLLMTFILQPNIIQLSRLLDTSAYQAFAKIVTKLSYFTLLIGLVIFIGAYLIGVQLLHFIFGVDFYEYKGGLMIIIVGAIANAVVAIFINVFVIMRRFKEQFYILLFTNGLLAVISAPVVELYGLLGGVTLFTIINILQVTLFWISYKLYLGRLEKNAEKN